MKPRTLAAIVAGIVLTTVAASEARMPGPCHRIEFKTELIKQACASGGQASARRAMKRFASEHKIKSCNECHKRLEPSFDLKPGALDRFRKLGGT